MDAIQIRRRRLVDDLEKEALAHPTQRKSFLEMVCPGQGLEFHPDFQELPVRASGGCNGARAE